MQLHGRATSALTCQFQQHTLDVLSHLLLLMEPQVEQTSCQLIMGLPKRPKLTVVA